MRLDVAFQALTTDIICDYAFAEDSCYLDEPDFKLEWKETIAGGFESGAMMRQFPFMLPMVTSMPIWFVEKGNKGAAYMMKWQGKVKEQVQNILNEIPEEKKSQGPDRSERTIFHTLRDSDLPPEEKSLQRLCDEGEILLGAGSETTAKTSTTILFYLIENPTVLRRLRDELETVMPNAHAPVSATTLENLPYFSAVISEGLRTSYGVTTRLPRVAPSEALRYKNWVIPPGTPVSETCYFVLMNPMIFPEPEKFDPERWIKDPMLGKYLVNFGKGSRRCLGLNLAYAELYLTISVLVSRLDFELFETTIKDIRIAQDFFTAAPDLTSKGVRVRVKERMDVVYRKALDTGMQDPAYAALVQVAAENSQIDDSVPDRGQLESTRKAISAVHAATKAFNDAAGTT